MNIVLLSGTLDGDPKLEKTISGAPDAVPLPNKRLPNVSA